MKSIFKFLCILLVVSGCDVKAPELPSLDIQTFSYEEVMQEKDHIEHEIGDTFNENQ